MYNPHSQTSWRSTANKFSSLIYVPGILIALFFYQGQFFLTILLLTVAVATFVKTLGLLNLAKAYGALKRSIWIGSIALLLLPWGIGGFQWILIAIILTVLLDVLIKPMVSSRSPVAQNQAGSQRNAPYYVPSTSPSSTQNSAYYTPPAPASPVPSYQPYEQGYQAIVESGDSENEEVTDSAYSQQYEQPQASYPQLLPPPQQ